MRLESTFCDVLLTNFIVGLRLFPELAELGAEDPAVADAGFEIKKGWPGEHKLGAELHSNSLTTKMLKNESIPECVISIWQP